MEEMYILHELQGDSSHEAETSQELTPDFNRQEPEEESTPERIDELPLEPIYEPWSESQLPHGHDPEVVPTEEPSPHWEMELAQAYVRPQPLDGVFPPEESLRMGTIFPNLSQPYDGRE